MRLHALEVVKTTDARLRPPDHTDEMYVPQARIEMPESKEDALVFPIPQTLRTLALAGLAVGSVSYLAVASAHIAHEATPARANSAPASAWSWYSTYGDNFYTWDFLSTSDSQSNVDWALRFLFTDEAEIDYIKDRLDGHGSNPSISPHLDDDGGKKYAYVFDGIEQTGSAWDADDGIKEGLSCDWDWRHMRLYAQTGEDQNYTILWSYYVLASAHRDYEGGGCSDEFDSTETTEDDWFDRFDVLVSSHSWSYSDYYNYFDNDSTTTDIGGGNHTFQSDGYPVRVWVD